MWQCTGRKIDDDDKEEEKDLLGAEKCLQVLDAGGAIGSMGIDLVSTLAAPKG